MDVLITGGAGTVGTAITDHLADDAEYSFTSIDLTDHPDPHVESVIADVTEADEVRPHFAGKDAVIHLAYEPLDIGGPWEQSIRWSETHGQNIRAHATTIETAIDAGVGTIVYASSNHAVGMYEVLNAPDIYSSEFDLTVDHTVAPRPDSMYGTEKVYGEGLGHLAADAHGVQFYALRIGAVRDPAYNHPYGDAEAGVDRDEIVRESDEYDEQVARLKCMWQSRRDLAHMVDRCLQDETVEFDVFYGVSANDRRWFDIDHAKEVLEYTPQDNGEEWDAPPDSS